MNLLVSGLVRKREAVTENPEADQSTTAMGILAHLVQEFIDQIRTNISKKI